MYFKRNEPFRYAFNKPLIGTIKFFDEKENEKEFPILILDISLNGIKFESAGDIPHGKSLHVEFSLLDQTYTKSGNVVWTKNFAKTVQYGIRLDTDESFHRQVTNILKQLVRMEQ